jgi:hypothetical protein
MIHATIAVLGMLAGGLGLQDVENPAYKQWAKFKVGTSVKHRSEMETSGQKMVTDMTRTLKSVDETKAVVTTATSMDMGGRKMDMPGSDENIMAKIKKVEPPADAPKTETGEEEIEAAGKKWKCKWMKLTSEAQGQKMTITTWMCDDVPGQMVKMVNEMAMGKQTTILVEVKQP